MMETKPEKKRRGGPRVQGRPPGYELMTDHQARRCADHFASKWEVPVQMGRGENLMPGELKALRRLLLHAYDLTHRRADRAERDTRTDR